MAKVAFPDKQVTEIKELTEGMCNVTYSIAFSDGSESILKIAAKDRSGNTSNEVNLMRAEITAMKLVAEKCSFKVADVQYYDTSNTICNGNYFFMEKLEGDNFHFVKEKMSEEEISAIGKELGRISRELSTIQNPDFGFLGEDTRYDSLFAFVKQMLMNLLLDAKKRDIDILYDGQTLLDQLEKEESAFREEPGGLIDRADPALFRSGGRRGDKHDNSGNERLHRECQARGINEVMKALLIYDLSFFILIHYILPHALLQSQTLSKIVRVHARGDDLLAVIHRDADTVVKIRAK